MASKWKKRLKQLEKKEKQKALELDKVDTQEKKKQKRADAEIEYTKAVADKLQLKTAKRKESLIREAKEQVFRTWCILTNTEGALLDRHFHQCMEGGACQFDQLEAYLFAVGPAWHPDVEARKWFVNPHDTDNALLRSHDKGVSEFEKQETKEKDPRAKKDFIEFAKDPRTLPIGDFYFKEQGMVYQVCIKGFCHHNPPHQFNMAESKESREQCMPPIYLRLPNVACRGKPLFEPSESYVPDDKELNIDQMSLKRVEQIEERARFKLKDMWICKNSGVIHFCGSMCERMKHRTQEGNVAMELNPEHTISCPLTGTVADDYFCSVNKWFGKNSYQRGYAKRREFLKMLREVRAVHAPNSLFVEYYGNAEFQGSDGHRAEDDETRLAFTQKSLCTKDMIAIMTEMLENNTVSNINRTYIKHVQRAKPFTPASMPRRRELINRFEYLRSFAITQFRALAMMLSDERHKSDRDIYEKNAHKIREVQNEYAAIQREKGNMVQVTDLIRIGTEIRKKTLQSSSPNLPGNHRLRDLTTTAKIWDIMIPYTIRSLNLWGVLKKNRIIESLFTHRLKEKKEAHVGVANKIAGTLNSNHMLISFKKPSSLPMLLLTDNNNNTNALVPANINNNSHSALVTTTNGNNNNNNNTTNKKNTNRKKRNGVDTKMTNVENLDYLLFSFASLYVLKEGIRLTRDNVQVVDVYESSDVLLNSLCPPRSMMSRFQTDSSQVKRMESLIFRGFRLAFRDLLVGQNELDIFEFNLGTIPLHCFRYRTKPSKQIIESIRSEEHEENEELLAHAYGLTQGKKYLNEFRKKRAGRKKGFTPEELRENMSADLDILLSGEPLYSTFSRSQSGSLSGFSNLSSSSGASSLFSSSNQKKKKNKKKKSSFGVSSVNGKLHVYRRRGSKNDLRNSSSQQKRRSTH